MPFRNVIIVDRCKLEYSMNYLICRKVDGEKKIFLDEIRLILIDSKQVSITTALIAELSNRKIKVIFTDEYHNPCSEIVSYQNNYYSYRKIKEQINISDNIKNSLWSLVIKEKINNQKRNLIYYEKIDSANLLNEYMNEIDIGDSTNREGHSAKVYFNSLFGKEFGRDKEIPINKYLNYGYSIILSDINREIKMLGYLTELGIHHIGESNPYNLSCDIIEPIRPFVDYYVLNNDLNGDNYKVKLVDMLSKLVTYNEKEYTLDNAIHLYVCCFMDSLIKNEINNIKFITYEL